MTETIEIYFDDLTPEAQQNMIEKFQTTERNENCGWGQTLISD